MLGPRGIRVVPVFFDSRKVVLLSVITKGFDDAVENTGLTRVSSL